MPPQLQYILKNAANSIVSCVSPGLPQQGHVKLLLFLAAFGEERGLLLSGPIALELSCDDRVDLEGTLLDRVYVGAVILPGLEEVLHLACRDFSNAKVGYQFPVVQLGALFKAGVDLQLPLPVLRAEQLEVELVLAGSSEVEVE